MKQLHFSTQERPGLPKKSGRKKLNRPRWLCLEKRHLVLSLIGWLSLTLLPSPPALASDVVEVLPITDKIIRIYLVDGHIDSYGPGETYANNITYINATDIGKASTLSTYSITSSDDSYYATSRNPINLGRKSKAEDYNSQYQDIPYVWGHWIYVELPRAMVPGKTYTVALANLVENKQSVTFTYNVNTLRSPAVHVNMVGFPSSGPKYAYLSQWMGDFNSSTHQQGGLELDDYAGNQFRLINYATGATAFSGTISKRLDKTAQETTSGDFGPEFNYSHADVWQCDFSNFSTPGEYVVAVDGLGCSYPFEIGNQATQEPFYYAMKGLFWQRQGIVKQMEDGKVMPRDHHPDDITWKWDANWPGGDDVSGFNTASPRVKGIWGYYQDAGDWDGYTTHVKVPMLLCLLYDLSPNQFKDGEMDNRYKLSPADASWIDESNNGLPDLLDEAGWLIKYFRRARTVLQNQYGGTGGVPGYVGRDGIPNDNSLTAWQDTREWYLSAENVEQTFNYAGLAAWYALCLNKFHQLTQSGNHPEYNAWMNEAQVAWNWAENRTATTDDERRARGFAAVNLYRTTTNTTYQSAFQDYANWEPYKGDGEWGNPNIYDIALSIYSFIPAGHPGLNTGLQNQAKNEIETKATNLKVNALNANAFRCPMEENQFFQLGPFSTPKLTLLPVAHKISGDAKYLEALQNATNYVLGGNQQNLTYLSGLGEASDVWIFNPNGWLTNNYNSKVYSNEPFIGYTSYFGTMNFWFTNSIFSEYWSREGSYPRANNSPNKWPEAESKFRNRYSIQGGEFTVHQQNNYMIYVMGYVKAMANVSISPYTLNARPTVSLNLSDDASFPKSGGTLTVNASADVRRVAYYYEWHYIGESYDKSNNFRLNWSPPLAEGTEVLVTAVGYDDRGRMTSPRDAGDKRVVVGAALPGDQTGEVSVRVSSTNDDAEETIGSGTVDLSSDDLDFRSTDICAVRFALDVPRGATIGSAVINFVAKGNTSGANTLTFTAQTSNDASAFGASNRNLSARNMTSASVSWSPGAWADGQTYTSPDLSALVQEVVNRSGWNPNQHLVIKVTASMANKRAARTYDYNGDDSQSPQLVVRYQGPGTATNARRAEPNRLAPPLTLDVFPNPLIADELTVGLGTTTSGDLEVRDMMGRLLLERHFDQQRRVSIRKEALTNGVLILTVRTRQGTTQTKLLVQ